MGNVGHVIKELAGASWDWLPDAECRDEDPSLFFPADGKITPAAQELCDRCPVQPECEAFVLGQRIEFGTFGGLSEYDRRAKRRKSRRVQAVTEGAHPPE